MTATIGSARIDENGKMYGGKAGDQNGREVSRQNWYRHSKGWRVFRAKDAAVAAKLADAMEAACDNARIGYDQYQRASLRTQAAACSPAFFPGAVKTNCETDCSELVRTCIAYAVGYDIIGSVIGSSRFSTANQAAVMLKTGLFAELTGTAYTDSDRLLQRGDILVTCTQGHTVICLTGCAQVSTVSLLKRGDSGNPVIQLQKKLMQLRYPLPGYGADGRFGSETLQAVQQFQKDHKLPQTGSCDAATAAAIDGILNGTADAGTVRVTGFSVYIRGGAGTEAPVLRAVRRGTLLKTSGTAANGWHHVGDGWISGKYTEAIA